MSHRLFRTTAFRLALLYACTYSVLSALGLGFIYWSTARHIDTQVDARLRLETEVLLNLYRARSLPALLDSIHQRSQEDDLRIFFYMLWGPDSRPLAGRIPAWPASLADAQQHYATLRLSEVFQLDKGQTDDWVRVLATDLGSGYRLLVGRDLHDEQQLLQHTLATTLIVVAVTFLLALLGSLIIGQNTLRRIDAVSRTAGEIMAGDLKQRIAISPKDNEFDELGRKLNAMLNRIEQLLSGMREVSENLAHDLRKPLTRLRNRLEVTLLEARSEGEYRTVLEQNIQDADELLKTFNALLSIAQAEAGVKPSDWSAVDLAAVCEDLADLYGAVAEEQGIGFTWSAAPGLMVEGNRQLLAQALGNLLDNAVKYTPAGGRILLLAALENGVPTLTVADTGSGIAASDRDHAERFVRLDSARSLPGSGLGLSLVKAVARQHQATLELADNQPGLKVILRFPPPPQRLQ
ncbi:MAG: ATP-binding protein [Gammaproteobacteria bacterium]